MARYLKLSQAFLTRLALLALILSGQPARSTELLSLRYRNTLAGGVRNLSLVHGAFSFVTLYHKGYTIGGSTKLIYRYLPPDLSQTLV